MKLHWMDYLIAVVFLLVLVTLLALVAGCGSTIVKHPDAPMLIIEARGRVKVAVEKAPGEIIEFGWVEPQAGWTLVKYDWSREVGD